MRTPHLSIIAGPNGAGKTTFAKEFLPHYAKCENFVNADLIAGGLSPFAPVELALARIRDRVAQGGHDVPVTDVRRRFGRSMQNFWKVYRPLLDSWTVFNTSTAPPALIAKEEDSKLTVADADVFSRILKSAER